MTKNDPYFTAVDDETDWGIPETISAEDSQGETEILISESPTSSWIRPLFLLITLSIGIIVTWEAYTTLLALLEFNVILGMLFGIILGGIFLVALIEMYRFFQGQRHLAEVQQLREQAELFIRERSHGKSEVFIERLKPLYQRTQAEWLNQTLSKQPDYLNDAEVVEYLSEDFLSRLDQQAYQYIQTESINTATMIALSPLASVDALVALWRSMTMVNRINQIYGLKLNRIGQGRLFFTILKATLLAASTEIVVSSIVEKTSTGITGLLAGSVAQGLGVGLYVSRLGQEAIRQSRPVTLTGKQPISASILLKGIQQKISSSKQD